MRNSNSESIALKTVMATIASKVTLAELSLDAIHLTSVALNMNDLRWVTQHPIRLIMSSTECGRRSFYPSIAPVWFEAYLELFRRIAKRKILAQPGVTKIRFAQSKGRYLDIMVETDYLTPYIEGMNTGDYPENATTVLFSFQRVLQSGAYGVGVLFKGKSNTYTFRIQYLKHLSNFGIKYACSMSSHIDTIIDLLATHVSAIRSDSLDFVQAFCDYKMEEANNGE